MNSGEFKSIDIGINTSQGRGSAIHIIANKPISAIQYADSDGSESSAFWSSQYFKRNYILPVSAQYVAIVCKEPNTTVTLYDEAGNRLNSIDCISDSEFPGKGYFGSAAGGENIPEGSMIKASAPIYMIYETSRSNDERNLLGSD